MSSTGVAFVPVAYAEDVTGGATEQGLGTEDANNGDNTDPQNELLGGGEGDQGQLGDSATGDTEGGLMMQMQTLGASRTMGDESHGFGLSGDKQLKNYLKDKFKTKTLEICAEGGAIHISYGDKEEVIEFSDLPWWLQAALKFVGIKGVSDLGLDDCETPDNPEPDVPSITLNTTKIVCELESSLPNWQGSDSATGITTADAIAYASDNDGCEVVDDWNFQWAGGEVAPVESGSYVGTIDGGAWSTAFSGSTTIPVSALTGGSLSVREVLRGGYIPFTFDENNKSNADNVTAELYCSGAGLNYDNLEWVRGLTDGDEVDCVAFNAPTEDQGSENPQTATVEMCKLDTKENSLSGWQLALLGDKVTDVSVNSKTNKNAGSSVKATLTSGDYVAKATGTFEYRSGTNLTADARFSERLPSDATYGGPYSPWATSSSGTAWLHMDGDATVWGDVFSPSHIYYAPITLTSDRDVEFYIGDNQHKDNKGNLTVDIYNGYTGVTGDNGCVTFESVPYGNYTVEELLQPEWENESGLGAVTIDSEYVVLSVMNQGPEEPIGQCTLQGDAKWASEVVSFDQGKRKDGTDVLAVRSDSSKALGVDDAADTNYDYVSLGFGGEIVLSFDYEIIDGPGDDFMVYETSTGNPSFNSYPEKADVYASQTGADGSWVLIGEAQHDTAFDLGGKINNVRFIKIVDTSETTQFGADADGFDVAGVEILYCGDEIDDDEPGDEVVTKRSQISISGTVYEDAELNDCYNMGTCKNEAGVLEGWTMRLYDSSWDLMQTAVSGADGIFKFSGFWVEEPGTVYVCEVLQDGWTQQTQTWSGSGYLVNTPNGSGETDEGPYCRTVNYASTGNYSNKSRFGNVNTADNDGDEEPGDFSISGTKTEVINGDEAMSEGWEIELYRLVDTVEVNSENSTAVSSSVSLNNSAQYLLEVSGTYKFGNPNRRADAEYISELGDWTDVANDTYEDDFLDLLVDGVARDWGEFDSSHTYYLPFAGTGSAASFLIKDRAFAYGDNEGVLTVRIFELADTDTTNNDGEYSFDDLEEGTYLVREVNQEGWTQVMPEIGHCELSLSANNPDDECDFVNRQDSDVPTNPQEGILKVQKLVLGTNTTGTGNFEITVTCESEFGETFLLGANGYKEFTLPAGDSCTVSETNPEGAVVSFSPDSTVTIVAGETRLVNVINDFSGSDGNNDGDDGDDNRGTASSTSSRGFASSRVLGDSTSAVDDDNGEVLGATTSVYPGMPNAGNATPFASVVVVQSLLIAAALFYYNRKVFVTRTENN